MPHERLAVGDRSLRDVLQVVARIVAFADAAQDPADYPTSPALAVPRALARAGLRPCDVDYWEINEAFSVVHLVNQQLLDIPPHRCGIVGNLDYVFSC